MSFLYHFFNGGSTCVQLHTRIVHVHAYNIMYSIYLYVASCHRFACFGSVAFCLLLLCAAVIKNQKDKNQFLVVGASFKQLDS